MTTVVPLNRDAENEREPTLEAGTGSHDESAAARQAEHDQRARLGMRPVASDGNHHGPWLWPIQYRTRGNNGKVEYNILQFSPEHFRCWGYSLFLLILFIGFILTEYFSYAPGKYESRECISRDAPGCKLSLDNPFNDSFIAWDYDKQADVYLTEDVAFGPLEAAYGYNNPCVYLDFPPANIILPVVWVFAVMSFCAGFFFSMVRHRVALNARIIRPKTFQILRACCFWQVFAYGSFSLCFAVSPIKVSSAGSKLVMIFHTGPFIFVELANWTHALSELWYEHESGYLASLHFPSKKCWLWTYATTLSLVTIVKVALQIIGLIMMPWIPPAWLTGGFANVTDKLYVFLSILVPWGKLIFEIGFRPDYLEVVEVKLTTMLGGVEEDVNLDGIPDK